MLATCGADVAVVVGVCTNLILLKALCHDIRRNCIVMTSLVQKSNQSGYRK